MSSPSHPSSPTVASHDIEQGTKNEKEEEHSPETTPRPPAAAAAAAAPSFPEGGRDAWLCVFAGFCVFCSGTGFLVSFSVFQYYYKNVTLPQSSDEDIAWIGSLAMALAFLMGLPAGKLSDKLGPKVPLGIATVLIVLGTMMASISTKFVHFILSQGLCSGIGYGLAFTPALAIPPQYFLTRRGIALAFVVGGSGVGGVVWPIAVNKMLNYDKLSLGWTLRTIGFVQLALMLLATLCIKSRFPRNMLKQAPPLKLYFTDLRVLSFTLATFLSFLALYVPYFYITPFGVHAGASIQAAYYYPSTLNAGAFFGRFVIGALADRVLGYYNSTLIFTFVTTIVAFGWFGVHNNAGSIIFSIFYGFFSGSLQSLLSPCIAQLAPSTMMMGTWVGLTVSIIAIAILASQPIAGRLLDNTAGMDYKPMQFYCGFMLLGASLLYAPSLYLIRRHRSKQ